MTIVRRALMVSAVAGTLMMSAPAAYAGPPASPSPSVSPSPKPTPTPTPSPTPPPSPTPSPTPTKPPTPCAKDEWTAYTPASPVGTAYAPNVYAEDSALVTNKTSTDFADPVFIFGVTAGAGANSGPAPLVRWRVDGGTWHQFQLHVLKMGADLPYWGTDNVGLPELRAKASYTVTIGMAFPAGTPGRSFSTEFLLGAAECGAANLGEDYAMAYAYKPPSPPAPTPTKSAGGSKSGGTTHATPTKTKKPVMTPSAVPSSTQTTTPVFQPSPLPTVTEPPVASPAPAPSLSLEASSQRRSSGLGWVIGAALLAIVTVCGIAYYRVKRA